MLSICEAAAWCPSRTNSTLDILTFLLLFCLFLFPDLKDNLMSKNGRAWDHSGYEQGAHHRQNEAKLHCHVRPCCGRSFSEPRVVAQLLLILQGASVTMLLP